MTERYEMALHAIIEICNKESPISKDAAVIVNIAEKALEQRCRPYPPPK